MALIATDLDLKIVSCNGATACVFRVDTDRVIGTPIDELVMIRVKNKGDLYVHQDANWNVIGLTDLGGRLVERYVYTP